MWIKQKPQNTSREDRFWMRPWPHKHEDTYNNSEKKMEINQHLNFLNKINMKLKNKNKGRYFSKLSRG